MQPNDTREPQRRAGVYAKIALPALGAIVMAALALFSPLTGTANAQVASVSSEYTYSCTSTAVPGAHVTGTFAFSPSPSTGTFSVLLTYHVPAGAQFVIVPGGAQEFSAGTTSPVSFDLSTDGVPAEANSIRIENSLNTSKSASFLCDDVAIATGTPSRTPPARTSTAVPTAPAGSTDTPTPQSEASATPTAGTGSTATSTTTTGGGSSPTATPRPAATSIAAAVTPTATRVNTVQGATSTRIGTIALPNAGTGVSAADGASATTGAILALGLVTLIGGALLRRRHAIL